MTERSAKDIARHDLYLLEREARPWQDDVRLIEVIRAERAERERTGNAVSALPLAVGLSAGIWALLWLLWWLA